MTDTITLHHCRASNEPTPDNAKTTHGQRTLADYQGKWLVLFSHPADFTSSVCTTEFMELYPHSMPMVQGNEHPRAARPVDRLELRPRHWVRSIKESSMSRSRSRSSRTSWSRWRRLWHGSPRASDMSRAHHLLHRPRRRLARHGLLPHVERPLDRRVCSPDAGLADGRHQQGRHARRLAATKMGSSSRCRTAPAAKETRAGEGYDYVDWYFQHQDPPEQGQGMTGGVGAAGIQRGKEFSWQTRVIAVATEIVRQAGPAAVGFAASSTEAAFAAATHVLSDPATSEAADHRQRARISIQRQGALPPLRPCRDQLCPRTGAGGRMAAGNACPCRSSLDLPICRATGRRADDRCAAFRRVQNVCFEIFNEGTRFARDGSQFDHPLRRGRRFSVKLPFQPLRYMFPELLRRHGLCHRRCRLHRGYPVHAGLWLCPRRLSGWGCPCHHRSVRRLLSLPGSQPQFLCRPGRQAATPMHGKPRSRSSAAATCISMTASAKAISWQCARHATPRSTCRA